MKVITTTVYDLKVVMDNGSVRTIKKTDVAQLQVNANADTVYIITKTPGDISSLKKCHISCILGEVTFDGTEYDGTTGKEAEDLRDDLLDAINGVFETAYSLQEIAEKIEYDFDSKTLAGHDLYTASQDILVKNFDVLCTETADSPGDAFTAKIETDDAVSFTLLTALEGAQANFVSGTHLTCAKKTTPFVLLSGQKLIVTPAGAIATSGKMNLVINYTVLVPATT